MDYTLDAIDHKIIDLLQKDARLPVKDIAKEVFLSSPVVSNRIEKLEKAGIITGYHAQINYQAFGYHIKAFINLFRKRNFIHTSIQFLMSLNVTA